TARRGAAGTTLATAPSVAVPGQVSITGSAAPGATQATHTGFVVLTRGSDHRRIPYWLRVTAPALAAAQTTSLTATGTYQGDTRGRPALVDSYRYPEDPRALELARTLSGPAQVFRVRLCERVGHW